MSIGKPKHRDYVDSDTGRFDDASFEEDMDEYESWKELEADDERWEDEDDE